MSLLACGLEFVKSQGPCWMPMVSCEPLPVKMSSVRLLTASETNADASAPLVDDGGTVLLSANTWSQSCDTLVEPELPRTPVVTLPSSSKPLRRLGVTRSSSCSISNDGRRQGSRQHVLPFVFRTTDSIQDFSDMVGTFQRRFSRSDWDEQANAIGVQTERRGFGLGQGRNLLGSETPPTSAKAREKKPPQLKPIAALVCPQQE